MSTADFSGITGAITATLTSSAAVSAYEAVAVVGLAIGVVVKLGPMLFRYVWRFIPDEGGGYDDYYESEEWARFREHNYEMFEDEEPWDEGRHGPWAGGDS